LSHFFQQEGTIDVITLNNKQLLHQ